MGKTHAAPESAASSSSASPSPITLSAEASAMRASREEVYSKLPGTRLPEIFSYLLI